MEISVVIIAKNEEKNIVECLESAFLISKNVIVADTGSTDNTVTLAKSKGASVVFLDWNGYGNARNEAAKTSQNDWILSLDADERVTTSLANSIKQLSLTDNSVLYGFKRESFLVNKKIKHGDWGRDKVFRLYHKQFTSWDLTPVHEDIISKGMKKKIIQGSLLHFTMDSIETFYNKTINYANLSATKYFNQHKKATIIKRFGSPIFAFIQSYFIRLGFLDGSEGYIIAKYSAFYVEWGLCEVIVKVILSLLDR